MKCLSVYQLKNLNFLLHRNLLISQHTFCFSLHLCSIAPHYTVSLLIPSTSPNSFHFPPLPPLLLSPVPPPPPPPTHTHTHQLFLPSIFVSYLLLPAGWPYSGAIEYIPLPTGGGRNIYTKQSPTELPASPGAEIIWNWSHCRHSGPTFQVNYLFNTMYDMYTLTYR